MIFRRISFLIIFLYLLNYLILVSCSELIFVHAVSKIQNFALVSFFHRFNFCLGKYEKVAIFQLWRHGDRNPVHLIPSDTRNNESSWVEGLGELTKVHLFWVSIIFFNAFIIFSPQQGITGQYNLGKLLRTRYIDNLKFIHPCSAFSEVKPIFAPIYKNLFMFYVSWFFRYTFEVPIIIER